MKRSINSCESGSSVISIPNGNAVAGSGKFERKFIPELVYAVLVTRVSSPWLNIATYAWIALV